MLPSQKQKKIGTKQDLSNFQQLTIRKMDPDRKPDSSVTMSWLDN